MTNSIHDTAIKVDVYPDEFKPIIKVLNRALDTNRMVEIMTPEEFNLVVGWLDDFKSLALEYAE
jgi:hypothetical protein